MLGAPLIGLVIQITVSTVLPIGDAALFMSAQAFAALAFAVLSLGYERFILLSAPLQAARGVGGEALRTHRQILIFRCASGAGACCLWGFSDGGGNAVGAAAIGFGAYLLLSAGGLFNEVLVALGRFARAGGVAYARRLALLVPLVAVGWFGAPPSLTFVASVIIVLAFVVSLLAIRSAVQAVHDTDRVSAEDALHAGHNHAELPHWNRVQAFRYGALPALAAIYTLTDVLMLQRWATPEDVVSFRLSALVLTSSTLGYVVIQRLSFSRLVLAVHEDRAFSRENRIFTSRAWMAVVAGLWVTAILAPTVFDRLVPPEAWNAQVFALLGVGYLVLYLPPYGEYLLARDRPIVAVRHSAVAAAINVPLNTYLIPLHGAIGAATAFLCSVCALRVLYIIRAGRDGMLPTARGWLAIIVGVAAILLALWLVYGGTISAL